MLFALSCRDVEELLAGRGVPVGYESERLGGGQVTMPVRGVTVACRAKR